MVLGGEPFDITDFADHAPTVAYEFSDLAVERVTREWLEVLDRDRSHPCIIAWVPVNESWGFRPS